MSKAATPARIVTPSKVLVALIGALGLIVAGIVQGQPASASPIAGNRIQVHPLYIPAGLPDAQTQFSCQDTPFTQPGGARCYTPSQIQNAYAITPLLQRA